MKFWKMQAAGNDYVYVDIRKEKTEQDWRELAVCASDRHFGIGGDGLVLIEASEIADCRMRIFNADGSEGYMCGNALRCIGYYLYQEETAASDAAFCVETRSGKRTVQVNQTEKGIQIWAGMGQVQVHPAVRIARTVGYPVQVGNPHLVLFRRRASEEECLEYGPILAHHDLWPEGCNVEFCHVEDREHITGYVWERGSGFTLSCGSGATAVFAAARSLGLVSPQAQIHMPGGTLRVKESNGELWLSGPVRYVFSGEY